MSGILFRVDAGAQTGLGHFYRSVHLAQELLTRGFDITFTYQPSAFWQQQQASGLPFLLQPLEPQTGLDELAIIQRDRRFTYLFVDGFIDYSPAYIEKIKQCGVTVIFYQNLSPAKSLPDIFIVPSLHQDAAFFADFPSTTEVYQGLDYFTFNQELSELPVKSPPQEIKHVAFAAGGSDPRHTLLTLYALLEASALPASLQCTFYYGENCVYRDRIPSSVRAGCEWKPFSHQAILDNDLLITTFGVSTYEFMALGMPVFSFGHQQSNAASLQYLAEQTGAVVDLGLIDTLDASTLAATIRAFVDESALSQRQVQNARAILDRRGVQRIAQIIEEKRHHAKRP